ncbi:MAG TPA: LamG-like jellyroll fold domain-containing protein [Candidatus Acidoferrum sp.]|nr:LamG-like jellyroll fold domain-containing protein [Candidatus Acidoferrum sp.]
MPAATPVAWWTFDNPAALGHDSAGTNDGFVVGSPLPCSGVSHSGILMNGSGDDRGDYLIVADSPSLEITGPMTALAWVNATPGNADYPILYKAVLGNAGQMPYELELVSDSGGYYPSFYVLQEDGNWAGRVTSPEALTMGQWHLIGGVYDGTNLMVYADGQLEASQPYNQGIYLGTDPLYIGWDWNGSWNGALDELRIYNVALTQQDMLQEFQSRAPALNASLAEPFGRVAVGQSRISQITMSDAGAGGIAVGPLLISGPDAAYFHLLTPNRGFLLSPGQTNAVAAQLRFTPDAARTYSALLTVNSSANGISIPLSGKGYNDKTFTLNLQNRNESGDLVVTPQAYRGSQMAVLVVDVWNSHPDSVMASRTASLVPRLNETLDAARDLGIAVIFCPSDCLADYDGTSYRSDIMNLPYCDTGDNGFDPPLPPYADVGLDDMVPPDKTVPEYPGPTHQHPDLVVKPGDLVSLSINEINNYCSQYGITSLLYTGAAANMCVTWMREFSMIYMNRFCGLETIMIRGLTDSLTLNGRSPDDYSIPDPTMTPDRGSSQVADQIQQYIGPTIGTYELMQQWAPCAYTYLVSGQSNLLCYWRLSSKSDYHSCLDIKRTQSCWWNNQTNGLGCAVPGAIVQDPDPAMQFKGSTTVLISPFYRDDIPLDSPLVSLSATNFTLEAWVQVAALNTNQWFFAHDNGSSNGVDVLLGLDQSNHFEFIVGTDGAHWGYGDVLESATAVTQADVASNRWFHVVATRDLGQKTVSLYVNGNLDAQGADVCQAVSLTSAPHLGSRGLVSVGADGTLSNPGFEFLQGTLDEVGIYTPPLSSNLIRLHYQTARGLPAKPVRLLARKSGTQCCLSWPAFSGGLWLQGSDSLKTPNWQCLTVPVLELNGTNQASLSTSNCSRFFRLGSQ